ncbi:hypothetical protein SAY86_018894 [Trapa natans]|uniref:Protein kinase domain-containing protein n=1 Tax=Trapa natans TaxID=22666 RepID=A0AAN7LE15_TRANT|nr:hypothetical protein SAY86_018894 [Trapa natans]
MQLDRLCFVLPADSDYNGSRNSRPPAPSPEIEPDKKPLEGGNTRRGCGKQIEALLGELLAHLYNSFRFLLQERPPKEGGKDRSPVLFFDTDGVQLSDKVGSWDNPRIFSYAELYIGSKGFSHEEVLGSGGFGRVYRAVLPSDGTAVAVKCVAGKGERFEKTFAAELAAVAHLRHRNLVRLRGWCVHGDELLLVYDYMPNRSLDRVLFRRMENDRITATAVPSPVIGWDRRRKIARGLAAGLHYLHDQLETQIIHRDVKASNVMLDSDFNARLGDFGLARWLEHELHHQTAAVLAETAIPVSLKSRRFRLADTTKMGGTIGYLPPESFEKGSMATAKSDVFSFGVVLLEIVSGRRAVDVTYSDDQIVLVDWVRRLSDEGQLLQAVDNRLRDGTFNLIDIEQMIHLGLLCTLQDPASRPTMKWAAEALSGSMAGKFPPLPPFFSHPRYISLSSSSNTTISSSTTTSVLSIPPSHYATAVQETLYATADQPETTTYNIDPKPSTIDGIPRSNFLVIETPQEISYKELVSATDNFSESRRVAEMDFGTAYYGLLGEGGEEEGQRRHVLVKRLGMSKCPALRARFSDELQNLGRLRHRNLVQLRGWCTEQGEMLVVYDYAATRLLSHLLFYHPRGRPALRWHDRCY